MTYRLTTFYLGFLILVVAWLVMGCGSGGGGNTPSPTPYTGTAKVLGSVTTERELLPWGVTSVKLYASGYGGDSRFLVTTDESEDNRTFQLTAPTGTYDLWIDYGWTMYISAVGKAYHFDDTHKVPGIVVDAPEVRLQPIVLPI